MVSRFRAYGSIPSGFRAAGVRVSIDFRTQSLGLGCSRQTRGFRSSEFRI